MKAMTITLSPVCTVDAAMWLRSWPGCCHASSQSRERSNVITLDQGTEFNTWEIKMCKGFVGAHGLLLRQPVVEETEDQICVICTGAYSLVKACQQLCSSGLLLLRKHYWF